MLTPRGWWFLFAAGLLTAAGVAVLGLWSATLPVLGLSLLAWVLFEWAVFAARYRATADRWEVRRVIVQGGREQTAAWAGRSVTVRVMVLQVGPARLPFAVIADRPPADVSLDGGSPRWAGDVRSGEPVRVEYAVRPTAAGVLRFEGVEVRVADPAGLFSRRAFVRAPAEFLVLPPPADAGPTPRDSKRHNALPPPGVHRLRRPGGGDELLDLRDYRPGDPPKTIAWKPSARRDRLITKEFESDVPVRCVLFVDASAGARAGPPGGTPLDRLVPVAAAVARAAVASRDLVGLTVFDDETANHLPPARTAAHTVRLLRRLAEAAGLPQHPGQDANVLARRADAVAQELYPDHLERPLNARPFGLFWRPVADSRLVWLVFLLLVAPVPLFHPAVLNAAAGVAAVVGPTGRGWVLLPFLFVGPPLLAVLIWFGYGVSGLFGKRPGRRSQRKRLGALFALADGAGPAAIERHLTDDEFFAERAGRFLSDHRIRPPARGNDLAEYARGGEKVRVLAGALLRAVGHARDNELYVIFADLLGAAEILGPLATAAKTARARHHRVVVVVPTPDAPPDGGTAAGRLFADALKSQTARRYAAVRAALGAAGVPVVRAAGGDAVRDVLDRLDRVRGVRAR